MKKMNLCRNGGKFTFIAVASVAIITLFFSSSCSKKNAEGKENNKKSPVLSVQVGKVMQGDVSHTVSLVGNVVPRRKAILTSKVPGKVMTIYHREGETVEENAKLAKIDPEDVDRGVQQARAALATAYAAASQAEIQRETLKQDFERMKELHERGAVSLEQLEKIEAGFKAAEAGVRMAQAGVRQAKAVLGDAASYRRATIIKAPFKGEVAKLLIEEGERIQTMPPSPIMVLMDYDAVKVECEVNERDVGVITEGMPAIVSLDAFPNSTIEAKVTRVVPVLDAATRTFTIKIELPNLDHRIKPGMMAKVKIDVVYPNLIYVKRDAISINNVTGQRRIVEVVDSQAFEREVVIDRTFGDMVELVELAGLHVGSDVITSGASDIFTGMTVSVVRAEAAQ